MYKYIYYVVELKVKKLTGNQVDQSETWSDQVILDKNDCTFVDHELGSVRLTVLVKLVLVCLFGF